MPELFRKQRSMLRKPRQQRSLYKVELMLEAAMRVLDKGGFACLTTNAVATAAGVSIGTLYQYFNNKESILDALSAREIERLSVRVMSVLQDRSELTLEERVSRIVEAVTESYGRRSKVHRLVMGYSLGQGHWRLQPLVEQIMALLTSDNRPDTAELRPPLGHAEAFVLTYAFFGVMRAMIQEDDLAPPRAEIERAMTRMLTGFARQRAIAEPLKAAKSRPPRAGR